MNSNSYKLLVEHAPYGIFTTDLDGNFIEFNDRFCNEISYKRSDLLKMRFEDLLPDDEKAASREAVNTLVDTGFVHDERKYIDGKGRTRYMDIKTVKADDDLYINYIQDVTEKFKLEERIDYEKNKTFKYFETANVIFVVLDKEGCVNDINEKGCNILEYSKKDIIGKNWFDNFIPQSNIKDVKNVYNQVSFGKINNVEFYENPIITSKGEEKIIAWHNNTIRDESGQISFIISAGNDITEQKKGEKEILESQQILNTILNTVPVRVFWKNRDLIYLGCNKQFALDAGFNEPEEVIGKDDYAMGWKDQAELYRSGDRQVIESGNKKLLIEEPQTTPDGKTIWLMTSKTPLRDSAGNIVGVLGAYMDITMRKRAEEQLIESEARYKSLFEYSGVEAKYIKPDGKILALNRKTFEYIDGNPEDYIGKSIFDLFPKEEADLYMERINKAVSSDEPQEYESKVQLPNGEKWYSSIYSKVMDENKQVLGVQITSADITELKETLKALEKNFMLIREAEQIGKLGYYERNWKTGEGYWSEGFFDLLGLKYDTPPSHNDFLKYIVEEEREQVEAYVRSTIAEKTNMDINFRIKRADSEIVDIHGTGENFYDSDGRPLSTIGLFQDITERKKAEQELRESEARYKPLFEYSGVEMGYYKTDGTIVSLNKKAIEKTGNTSGHFIGKSIFDVFSKEDADLLMKRINDAALSDEPQEYEDKDQLPDGATWYLSTYSRVIDENGKILGVQAAVKDITEKKNMEIERAVLQSQLRNQQKLESIGTLASGVAHEINNPINGILNFGQIILDSADESSSIKEYAGEIIHETNRVSEIVKNLLDFSRQNKQGHSYANMEDIISRTLSLINTVIKKDQIELNVHIADDLPRTKCRSQQIQQVLMNLVTNARDALNQKYPIYDPNKKIEISCTTFDADERKWLRLVVEDSGTGIPKDNLDEIFDPFFTTKGREKGTGLGLSISYGIIKEHHGEIFVETEEGNFTRFTVNLPCDNGWELK